MHKADLRLLERCFEAEVSSALNGGIHLFQSKSKRMEKLEADGYVRKSSVSLGGRYPVTVTGYELTQLGHLAYCTSC